MTPVIKVDALKCLRCGHVWLPRKYNMHGGAKPVACGSCKSPYWNIPTKDMNKKKVKAHSATIAIALGLSLLMILGAITANQHLVFAATKTSSDTKSSTSSSSSDSHDSGDSGTSGTKSDSGSSGVDHKDSSSGNSKTVDDGFTDKDGKQPTGFTTKDGVVHKGFPTFPIGGPIFNHNHFPFGCELSHNSDKCTHRHHHDTDVKVIQKTVVVHDNNNKPRDVIIVQNQQTGNCIVTTQQISDTPDLVNQLLNTCTSITILNDLGNVVNNPTGAATATATAKAG